MSKRYWKDEPEYKRIIQVLEDYWLTEKDEDTVFIKMYFKHSDGREQEKLIRWYNPENYKGQAPGYEVLSISDIEERFRIIEEFKKQHPGLLEWYTGW